MNMKKFTKKIFTEVNKRATKSGVQTGIVTEVLGDNTYKVRIKGHNEVISNVTPVNRNATFVVGQKVVVGNAYNQNQNWYIFGDSDTQLDDSLVNGEFETEETKLVDTEGEEDTLDEEDYEELDQNAMSIYLDIRQEIEWQDSTTGATLYKYSITPRGAFSGQALIFMRKEYPTVTDLKDWYLFDVLNKNETLTFVSGVDIPTGMYYFIGVIWNGNSKAEIKSDFAVDSLQLRKLASRICPVVIRAKDINLADFETRQLYGFPDLDGYYLIKKFKNSFENKIFGTWIKFTNDHEIREQYYPQGDENIISNMPYGFNAYPARSISGEQYISTSNGKFAMNKGSNILVVNVYGGDHKIYRFNLQSGLPLYILNPNDFPFLSGKGVEVHYGNFQFNWATYLPNTDGWINQARVFVLAPSGVAYGMLGISSSNMWHYNYHPRWEIWSISYECNLEQSKGELTADDYLTLNIVGVIFLNPVTIAFGGVYRWGNNFWQGCDYNGAIYMMNYNGGVYKYYICTNYLDQGARANHSSCISWGPSNPGYRYMNDFKKDYFYTGRWVWATNCACGCCFQLTKIKKSGDTELVLYAQGKAFCSPNDIYGWELHPSFQGSGYVCDLITITPWHSDMVWNEEGTAWTQVITGDDPTPEGFQLNSQWNLKRFAVANLSYSGLKQAGDVSLPILGWPLSVKFWDGEHNITYTVTVNGATKLVKVRNGSVVYMGASSYYSYNLSGDSFYKKKHIAMLMRDV